jgi:hypothetical protein
MTKPLLELQLLMFLFLISVEANSQSNFNNPSESAYLVMSSGDTLQGMISFVRRKSLHKRLTFISDKNIPKFVNSDVEYFYLKKSGELFNYRLLVNQQKIDETINFDSITFLKVLVTGGSNLYKYQNGLKTKYVVSIDKVTKQLDKGDRVTKNIDGKLYDTSLKPYQKTLERLFLGCTIVPKSLRYNDFDLENIVAEHNNECLHTKSRKYPNSRSKVLIGITTGYLISNLTFSNLNATVRPYGYSNLAPFGQYDLSNLLNTKSQSNSFPFGISYTKFSKSNKHISYQAQLMLVKRNWSNDLFSLNVSYLEMPFTFQYNFNLKSSFQPKIGLGVDLAVDVNRKIKNDNVNWQFYRTKTIMGGGDTWPAVLPVSMPAIFDKELKSFLFNPIGNIGLDIVQQKSIISISVAQGIPFSTTKSPLYKSHISNQMFTLGYAWVL